MAPFARFVTALLACLVCVLAAPSRPAADALGDPLPEGAVARVGTTRMRHSSTPEKYCWGIGSIAWSPDGKLIATASYADEAGIEARLWDAATGKPMSVLENSVRHGPRLVRFAPDGKTLAATARDRIVLWDTATGKETGLLAGHRSTVDALVFRDGGKTIVSVDRDGAVHWWDVAARKTVRQWRSLADDPKRTPKGAAILSRGIHHACFSADGKTLAVSKWWKTRLDNPYTENFAIVFDLGAREELWHEDNTVYNCQFAFTPDGKRVVLSGGASFRLHDTATGRVLSRLHHKLAWGMEFSPDGKELALCLGGRVAYWSPDTDKILREVESPLHGGGYNTFRSRPAFSPDGKKLAIDRKRTFQILDVASGKRAVHWPSHDEGITDLRFSADGRRLLADGLAVDTATWRQREAADEPRGKFKELQAFSLDRTRCVAADGKHPDAVFDVQSGKLLARLAAPRREPGTHGGFFSPNASHYVMQDRLCDHKEVDTVFAIPTGKRLWQASFDGHVGTKEWSFSADGARIAFLETKTGTVQVRDTATGKVLRRFGKPLEPVALALSPDGETLAIWDEARQAVQAWDVKTGKPARSLVIGQKTNSEESARLLWSADGRTLAVGAPDFSILLWEPALGKVRHRFRGHLDQISCLAFSPDGKLLASASEDTTLLVWKLAADR